MFASYITQQRILDMADHEIPYAGTSTLGTVEVDRGDAIHVKNDSQVTVHVTWPNCLDPQPTGDEAVLPNESSASHTISANATLYEYYQVTVKPPESRKFGDELPETGVGNVYIKG
jgi:hypothetical protein